VNLLGSWPPGSILLLDTHEAAIAHYTPNSAVGARPIAKLLVSNGDSGFSAGETVDLSEIDPATGLFRRNIVSTAHAAQLDIQPVSYLLPEA
jgi:hypothetical protein